MYSMRKALAHAMNAVRKLEAINPTTLSEAEQEARAQMLEQAHAVIRYITKQQITLVLAAIEQRRQLHG